MEQTKETYFTPIFKRDALKGEIMKRKKSKTITRLNEMLEMPKEVVSNVPKLTITGFQEMVVENYKGILEYEEFFVRVNTYIGIININGFGLMLEHMNDENIIVKGKIESIEIQNITDGEE